MKPKGIMVTCAKGLSPYLREELIGLGFPVTGESASGVMTRGTLTDTMKLNLCLRTAHRVLYTVGEFQAATPEALYAGASAMEWENWIPEDGYLSVTSHVENPFIRDSRYANMKCKDAIVDRISRVRGKRPDSGPNRSKAVVALHWKEDRCRLYLDTSGEPLSKRGYRKSGVKAPLQETLAAGLLLAAGWDGHGNFVNPMCGSGTLAIEAALIGTGRAPGLTRENFGFMHLRGFDPAAWRTILADAAIVRSRTDGAIVATDHDRAAMAAAKENAVRAGIADLIDFRQCDFADTPVPEGSGLVMLNPGYGERLGEVRELEATYHRIGDFFKQRCQGYTGYIFTGNPDLAKRVGLKARSKLPFYNGPIECRLLKYELYAGSRKIRKQEGDGDGR